MFKVNIDNLTRICSINNHPVSKLPLDIRQRYVSGLWQVLSNYFTIVKSSYINVIFQTWANSILGDDCLMKTDIPAKKAIKINRIGLHWFRLTYQFYFDCFYLVTTCNPNAKEKLFSYLKDNVCNCFTKQALQQVFDYFNSHQQCNKIPQELTDHRNYNLRIKSEPLLRVLVVASVSAGKSTLINALVGYKLNKVKSVACTNQLCYIANKLKPDGVTLKERNTVIYSYSTNFDKISSDTYSEIAFPFDSKALSSKKVCFIDTPGYNNASAEGESHKQITENAIKENDYDVILYIANANYMGREDEQELLNFIIKHTQKPILFVMNKLDSFHPSDDSIEESVRRYKADLMKLGISHSRIFPISAEAALLMKQEKRGTLSEDEQWYLDSYKKKFSKSFYNLPKYANFPCDWQEDSLLDRTGITLLENNIIRYL